MKRVTKDVIVVVWDDDSETRVELGRRFGSAGGSTFPHEVTTRLKEGERLEAGDVVAYNSNFFTPEPTNPKRVIWKAGVLCKTALLESTSTFEDSSAISEKIAREMGTHITHIRVLKFDFEQEVSNLVTEGEDVTPETILCTIEDSVTADNDLFNEETRDTLRLLAANTPRASHGGKVERIEVFYNGDKDDMSSSLRDITDLYDKRLAKRYRDLGKKPVTGEVGDGMKFDGQPLDVDQIAIRLYVTEEKSIGSGDKGVFGGQLKTIFAGVMFGTNQTESGEDIDAVFGFKSVSARIVESPVIMGTTNTLLKVISKKVANEYFK